jgi:hypothetical protein
LNFSFLIYYFLHFSDFWIVSQFFRWFYLYIYIYIFCFWLSEKKSDFFFYLPNSFGWIMFQVFQIFFGFLISQKIKIDDCFWILKLKLAVTQNWELELAKFKCRF